MHWRRPRAAAFLAAASFAALSCGDSSGPGGLSFQNASLLATRLESIDRAGWFGLDIARQKLLPGQAGFLDQLERLNLAP